jgi:hypothetical protein
VKVRVRAEQGAFRSKFKGTRSRSSSYYPSLLFQLTIIRSSYPNTRFTSATDWTVHAPEWSVNRRGQSDDSLERDRQQANASLQHRILVYC